MVVSFVCLFVLSFFPFVRSLNTKALRRNTILAKASKLIDILLLENVFFLKRDRLLSLSLTHTHTHILTHSLFLFPSLSSTQIHILSSHTLSFYLIIFHAHTLSRFYTLSLTHTHKDKKQKGLLGPALSSRPYPLSDILRSKNSFLSFHFSFFLSFLLFCFVVIQLSSRCCCCINTMKKSFILDIVTTQH